MKNYVENVDLALDMTAGNGNDSKNIIEILKAKKLLAFDIQEEAKKASIDLLKRADIDLDRVKFILDGHENVYKYLDEGVDFAIYNLGYLPKSDHMITTSYDKVLESLKHLLGFLNKKGIIVITFYPGHDSGMKESLEIPKFLQELDQRQFTIVKFDFINQKNKPPFSIMIQKN